MLKLLQGGGQRRFDVFGVGAGAKVQQQLTNVTVTFFHAQINFFEDFCHGIRFAGFDGVTHQLHLNLQKRQRLGYRVMQFTRKQVAFLRHGGLFLKCIESQVFHAAGQVRVEHFEQRYFGLGEVDARVKKQINLAHEALLQSHRDSNQSLKSRLGAMSRSAFWGWRHGMNWDDLQPAACIVAATMAVAGVNALLGIHHGQRQTMRCKHQVAQVALAGPAQSDAVGPRDTRHMLYKLLRQGFQ